jgi:hypothetical protein
MLERFEDVQLSVFVPLVLEHFLDRDFLASPAQMPVEHSAKRAFSGHTINLIPVSRADGFDLIGRADFTDFPAMNMMTLIKQGILLIGLSPDILVQGKWLGGMDFKGLAGEALLGLDFGVDLKVAGLVGLLVVLDSMGGGIEELVGFVGRAGLVGLGLKPALKLDWGLGGFGFGVVLGRRKSIAKVHNNNLVCYTGVKTL